MNKLNMNPPEIGHERRDEMNRVDFDLKTFQEGAIAVTRRAIVRAAAEIGKLVEQQ